jgi:hypothetical protein
MRVLGHFSDNPHPQGDKNPFAHLLHASDDVISGFPQSLAPLSEPSAYRTLFSLPRTTADRQFSKTHHACANHLPPDSLKKENLFQDFPKPPPHPTVRVFPKSSRHLPEVFPESS